MIVDVTTVYFLALIYSSLVYKHMRYETVCVERCQHDESLCQLQLLFTISEILTLHSSHERYSRSSYHVILFVSIECSV